MSPSKSKGKGRQGKTEGQAGPPEKAEKKVQPSDFLIAGIGASAGGLEAFVEFLKYLPPNNGICYIYIQHLAPRHESMLTEILARETKMPVKSAADGMAVEPDTLYVIPPGYYMSIRGGKLRLIPSEDSPVPRMPVDYFLRALAADTGGRSIGVVLSGTASDGTMGLMAIKAAGGITFAQDVKTAKYDGMPRSAIAAGFADFVLTPKGIAEEFARLGKHPSVTKEQPKLSDEALIAQESLERIFMLLNASSGVDFSHYKPSTIRRRIIRRMLLQRIDKVENYVTFLQDHPSELNILFQDVLINVTSFFREPEAFDILKEKVFPALLEGRNQSTPVRIWVPGCSTGEEAYSMAMALFEYLGDKAATTPIQIFATDIDDAALERARAGKYPESISTDLSPERLKRFFLKADHGYLISKQIRDLCIFAKHNIVKDPPFSRLDLISCRNLLIYLGPVLQKKIFPIFHYALGAHGFLLLGSSETVGKFSELFTMIDKKQKVYSKKLGPETPYVHFATEFDRAVPRLEEPPKKEYAKFDLMREADRLILSRYAPPSVLVNRNMEVVKFSGSTGQFLEHAPGEASLNLFNMVKEGLAFELKKAIRAVSKNKTSVRVEGVNFRDAGSVKSVNIEVTPLGIPGKEDKDLLIVFEEAPKAPAHAPETEEAGVKGKKSEKRAKELAELRQELATTKDYLQSIIEEQEATNEELRSANEEIQSANEELQSTNEELETAKEELQSANEELATVNDELESRNQELSRVNDDLNNLLSSVNIPIVILERDLKIRRFTPISKNVLNLIPSDIGRPLSDIKPNIEIKNLDQLVAEVIDSVSIKVQEVQDNGGRWYSLRIHPYFTMDKKVDGAVLVLIDIDALKRGMEEAESARDYAKAIEFSVAYPILVLSEELRIVSTSETFSKVFGVDPKEVVGNNLYSVLGGSLNVPGLKEKLELTARTGLPFECFITIVETKDGRRSFEFCAKQITLERKKQKLVLLELKEP